MPLNQNVEKFINQTRPLLIGDRWLETDDSHRWVINPSRWREDCRGIFGFVPQVRLDAAQWLRKSGLRVACLEADAAS